MDSAAHRVTDSLAFHAEGPFWDHEARRLRWLDLLAGRVLSTSVDSAETTITQVPDAVAAIIRKADDGRHVVAGEQTLWLGNLDAPDPGWSVAGQLGFGEGIRANEGASAPDGSLFVGSMAYDERPGAGRVIRIDAEGVRTVALSEVTIANGMHVEGPESVLFIDSPRKCVTRYRIDPARGWVSPSVVVDLSDAPGVPDGMAVDTEGGMWIAMWDGARVVHYSPTGHLEGSVKLPVGRPTSCAFGGDDLSTLFITTSRVGAREGESSPSGSLFAVDTHAFGQVAPTVRTHQHATCPPDTASHATTGDEQ